MTSITIIKNLNWGIINQYAALLIINVMRRDLANIGSCQIPTLLQHLSLEIEKIMSQDKMMFKYLQHLPGKYSWPICHQEQTALVPREAFGLAGTLGGRLCNV